MCTDVT